MRLSDSVSLRKGDERMEREWRCKECDTLLGVARGNRLHLRYKQVQYVVDGGDYSVIAVCRNCSTLNERNLSSQSSVPAAAGK